MKAIEFIQRAEGGGSPLSNDTADYYEINHGTPLIVLEKRKFVAMLLNIREMAAQAGDTKLVDRILPLLEEHDQFVVKVRTEEMFE